MGKVNCGNPSVTLALSWGVFYMRGRGGSRDNTHAWAWRVEGQHTCMGVEGRGATHMRGRGRSRDNTHAWAWRTEGL